VILKNFANAEEKAKKKKSQVGGSDSTAADCIWQSISIRVASCLSTRLHLSALNLNGLNKFKYQLSFSCFTDFFLVETDFSPHI